MTGRLSRGWGRLWRWALVDEGSTRSLGILRICVALMLWARFADFFLVFPDSTPRDLLMSAAFYLGTLALLVGAWTPVAAALVAGLMLYGYEWVHPYEKDTRWNSHNISLLVLTTALLALTPCGRSYSVDRWRGVRRARAAEQPLPREHGPLWGQRLLGLLVSSVYLSTALDKSSLAYLSGERLAAIFAAHYTGSTLLDGNVWEGLMLVAASGVWLLEGTLVFGLAVRRLRVPVALAGIALHGSFTALFRVFTFSQNMVLLYLPWFPTQQVHDLTDRLAPAGGDAAPCDAPTTGLRRGLRAIAMVVVLGLLATGAALDLSAQDSSAQDSSAQDPVAKVQLLEDRADSFYRDSETDRKDRTRRDRRDMQRWRRP